ncbi:WD40-repeat-containing domain protein [Chytriomyces sp. MP71]|nr:WD40-repeat-containing domain protein [Chytriomyces sp. MP71]
MAFEVFPDPVNPHVFFSSSDDGTVNQYDTRIAESCDCRTSCDRFTIIDVNRSICKHPSARAEISSFNSSATSATKRSVSKTMRPFDPSPPPERRRFFFASSASGTGVSALSIHPVHTNYLAIGSSDDIVRIFDRRVLKPPGNIDWSPSHTDTERGEVYNFLPAKFVEGPETYPDGVRRRPTPPHKITSLKFDPSGFSMDLLVSYSDEKVYIVRPNNGAEYIPPLSDLAFPETRGDIDLVRGFQGHRNRQTMIKEAYWLGPRSQVVMSGSDDGSLVVWDRETGKMINRVKADKSVVNCIAPNPVYHGMVAVSGIDSDVKILRPTLSESWLEKTQATARKQNDHGDDSASEDAEESVDDDEEGNDGLAEEPIRIPRDLLLLYLTRMGVEIGDLLGVGEDSGDQVDGSEGEASQASEGV